MLHEPASYFRLVTKVIPGVAGGNTGTDFTFDDQPDLRYARLQSMVVYTDGDLDYAQPQPVPVLASHLANKVSFVFQTNDPDDIRMSDGKKSKGDNGRFSGTLDTIQWLPFSSLHINQSFGPTGNQPSFVRQPIFWKDRYIVWQKSHIKISPGGLLNTTDVAICVGVYYTFTNSKGQIIEPRN